MSDDKYSKLVICTEHETIGKDPRKFSKKEIDDCGFIPKPLSKIIKEKCVDCCGGDQSEVLKCTSISCPLWLYRTGKNPFNKLNAKEMSQEQKQVLRDRLSIIRENKKKKQP